MKQRWFSSGKPDDINSIVYRIDRLEQPVLFALIRITIQLRPPSSKTDYDRRSRANCLQWVCFLRWDMDGRVTAFDIDPIKYIYIYCILKG